MRYFLSLGIVFGICVLIRPAIVPFIAVLIAGVFLYGRKNGQLRVWRTISAVVIGFVLVMLPWWIRNFITLNKVLLLAEQSGNPLLWGSYPFNAHPEIDISQDPAEMGKMAYHRIIEGFRDHFFVYFSWYTWGKMMFFIRDIFPSLQFITTNLWVRSIITTLHIIGILIGWIGLLKMVTHERKNGMYMMLALLAFVSVMLYLPFVPSPRYFYPVIPLCFLGLGYLITCVYRRKDRFVS